MTELARYIMLQVLKFLSKNHQRNSIRLCVWNSITRNFLSFPLSLFQRAQVVFQELFDTPNWRIASGTINSPGTEKRWLAWLRKIKGPRSSDP